VVTVAADASTDDGLAATLDAVRGADGELHGVVNVAGGADPSTWMPSTRVTRSDWRELFTRNLETMFFMSQAVAAELKRRNRPGSIVSVSSISGMNTAPFHIAYGTAKAAIVAATRTMALELAAGPDGTAIRVNAVAPGVTQTPASGTYVDEDPERDHRAIAMGRRGRPEEVAGAILFLLSDLSSYITGQTLLVDGGLNLKWGHLAADNTSMFLKDESFRTAIKSWDGG
jgi:3-oxoacyl-[acyl-carrier protein] reductase